MDHIEKVSANDGGIQEFTQGYKYFGMHFNSDNSVTCREWAPGAANLFLAGDFSKFFASLVVLDTKMFCICRSVEPPKSSVQQTAIWKI